MSASTWEQGNRVFAPLEPDFFYPATVLHVGKQSVMVEYDDGDEGLVPKQELQPIRLIPGLTVQARRKDDDLIYEWAEVVEADGERIRIRFHEDDRVQRVHIGNIRLPHPNVLDLVEAEAHLSSLWRDGDRVLAPWEPYFVYPATIQKVETDTAVVEYDDGDAGPVSLVDLQPIDIEPDVEVQARRIKFEKFYEPATVIDVNGETVTVRYHNDGHEEEMDIEYIRIPRRVPGAQTQW